jgi:NAD(P)-dependent dehydrogenase (short-subunit alcohol dehydrogenase family)
MSPKPFALVSPSTRGLSCALTRYLLRNTQLPVYATYRSGSAEEVKQHLLSPLKDIEPSRLQVLQLDLEHESSIRSAAENLQGLLPGDSYLHTAFFTGGILHAEKQPGDLVFSDVQKIFQINVISHLMFMKYFYPFLPSNSSFDRSKRPLSKWVHITARVGSITDNKTGGWYSYRSSKAALNQALRTFDLHLQQKKIPALCVGLHPGTMKTELSRDFWKSVADGKLFDPEFSAEKLVNFVAALKEDGRGKVWDWDGKQVPW